MRGWGWRGLLISSVGQAAAVGSTNGQRAGELSRPVQPKKAAEVLCCLLPGHPEQLSCSTAPLHLGLRCLEQDCGCKSPALSLPSHGPDLDSAAETTAKHCAEAQKPTATPFKTRL